MALIGTRPQKQLSPSSARRGQVLPLHPQVALEDDASLLLAMRDGQPGAGQRVWAKFAPLVHRLLRRTLGPSVDVEDVAQDVFMCLFRKVEELRDPGALRAFVVTITMLTAKARLRRRWRERHLFFPWVHDGPQSGHAGGHGNDGQGGSHLAVATSAAGLPVFADHEARQALQHFYKLLDRFNATDRAVFVLRFVEEMEMAEVAATLQISLSTAKRKARRVWERMRAAVGRDPALASFLPESEGP